MAKTDWSNPRTKPNSGNLKPKTAPKRDWSRQQDDNKRQLRLSPAERRAQKEQQHELNELMKQEQLTVQRIEERRKREERKKLEQQTREVFIPQIVNVANLARILGIRIERIVETMQTLEMGNTSHDRMLSGDDASLIALDLGINPVVDERQALDLFPAPPPAEPANLPIRPPVVTIMGHVDHGKTTLLDSLRKSSVAAGEAGGITQHIGAFSVQLPSKKSITFLDTPGHAAFSSMRARGAQVTDIVVLVVAADDGVMPQTQEAIQHAQTAGVPIVVAINKCDKPNVDVSKVKQELIRYNVHLEEIGGDVPAVEVSGLTGKNLDQLEETIAALSDVLELRAEKKSKQTEAVVLESQVEKGRGNVATVLVCRGTLTPGQVVVAGRTWCKVRSMTDHQGRTLKEATPGMPVKTTAKTVVENRIARYKREQQLQDLEVINDKRQQQRELLEQERMIEKEYKKEMYMFHKGLIEAPPSSLGKQLSAIQNKLADEHSGEAQDNRIEFRAIVKGDVSGTVEAVVQSLGMLQNKQIFVKIVHSGVGNISEGDVQLAAACQGHIIGFNVKADKKIQMEAQRQNVTVKSYSIIYKLLEDVKDQLSDMLPPIVTTQVTGEASILQVFDITLKGRDTRPVAGCRITNGVIRRNDRVRVLRDKLVVWEGSLEALRQVKKEISEAKKGLECGISFNGYLNFQTGDIIQGIELIETKQRL
ncbi:translation initiation factor IF-2 [Syncephalastrum racemosum]|uniref:Translation initiation factor IF-2, mitochondrial n=1 Tax=Syncephalastrum racemosum TaxID=13706 RepID=A0A1X2H724_SYNRA|nr:translation initiation factor IF-2 [Syncephalastrum racemosum]